MPKTELNVLFISTWYPNRKNPTLGNFIQKHAEVITDRVNLKVLAVTGDDSIQKIEIVNSIENGVDTTTVYYPKKNNIIGKWISFKRAYNAGLNDLIDDRRSKFDIIHANITFPVALIARRWSRRLNIPYIITEQWTGYLPHRGGIKWYNKPLHKYAFGKAKVVCTVSQHLGESLSRLGLIKQFKTIYNVVNTDMFYPNYIKGNKIQFLHISSVDDKHKNISGILKAISQLSQEFQNFELKIISDGDLTLTRQLIKQYEIGDFVNIETTKSPQELVKYYQESNAFVLFSNYETFSVVIAEAWSCGIPCIYSKCGGLTEIKNDNLGIQIEAKNTKQLFEAMRKFMLNEVTFDNDKIRAFAVKNFSNEIIANQFLETYQSVLSKNN